MCARVVYTTSKLYITNVVLCCAFGERNQIGHDHEDVQFYISS